MSKRKAPVVVSVRTSTISVTKPVNFKKLIKEFKLIRYVVPDRYRASNAGKVFERIHAYLKEQLDYPYKSYKFDKVDGPDRWAVYVLYPKSIEPLELKAIDQTMDWEPVDFDVPAFHILLKLLQVQFFRSDAQGKFVGRDSCYMYAKRDGKSAHICMEIELQGDLANEEGQQTQLFQIVGSVHKFVRPSKAIEEGKQYLNSYYSVSRVTDEGLVFFHQLKPSQVIGLSKNKKETIYEQRAFEGRRATLDYYSLDEVERSRGYLIDSFITGFGGFLKKYDLIVQAVTRQFNEFTPSQEVTEFTLPLELLETVYLYDMRKQRTIPIEQYRGLFQGQFPQVEFKTLSDVTSELDGAILFIMDFAPEAFDEEMPLYGEYDPYKDLYEQYRHIPKQGMNVNPNDISEADEQDDPKAWYLNCEMLDGDDKNVRDRVSVAMNQLFLKDLVMRERILTQRLPISSMPFLFVRKATQGTSYETALYTHRGTARFLDLRNPIHERAFVRILQILGVDRKACYQLMAARYKKQEGRELKRYDVIVGPGQFVEIADLNERVLYEFDVIKERQEKRRISFPLPHFKLSHRYDDLRLGSMLPLAELLRQGLIHPEGTVLHSGKNRKQIDSLEFFGQLHQYDALLDEMQLQHPEMSFEELLDDEHWFPRIAQTFGRQADEKGKYTSRFLTDLYRRIGIFPSVRQGSLTPTYHGIWYDDDHRFIVGDVNALKLTGQAKAHLVRQFVIYEGKTRFRVDDLLDATSVRFVRLNQFTVYPYFFHLIDLYVENVLRYAF